MQLLSRTERSKLEEEAKDLLGELFPLKRSLTGRGLRQTLDILSRGQNMGIKHVPTGTQIFDWTIPKEWNLNEAYLITPTGEKICSTHNNNLHVWNYSVPFRGEMTLARLKEKHLITIPEVPTAIPYVTTYYEENWGFSISFAQLKDLPDGIYQVHIDTTLEEGVLSFGEIVLDGLTERSFILSTYVCHPQMANNELSGPIVLALLTKLLKTRSLRYTYRFVFAPETIGTLAYIRDRGHSIVQQTVGAFIVTCVGDGGPFTIKESQYPASTVDRLAAVAWRSNDFRQVRRSFAPFGSDERQYTSPGLDIPTVVLSRSMFAEFREYHTSLDNLSLVTPQNLIDSLEKLYQLILSIEDNYVPKSLVIYGEPFYQKYNLISSIGGNRVRDADTVKRKWLMNRSDGKRDLLEISAQSNIPVPELLVEARKLEDKGLLEISNAPIW